MILYNRNYGTIQPHLLFLPFFLLFLWRCRLVRVFLYHSRISLFMESTSYVFLFRVVFFYLVTTGLIFDISLYENSINSISINQGTAVIQELRYKTVHVVVDSHIQRIVFATEETTVTQQVSDRPIKCQSRLWSQRGTKVNGSHHGDNPLLRPIGIQIATKR